MDKEVRHLSDWLRAETLASPGQSQSGSAFLLCNSHGKVLLCSPGAATLYGASPADVEGLSMSLLLPAAKPSHRSASYLGRNLAYLSGCDDWRRFDAVAPDGHRFPVQAAITKIEIDHAPLYLCRLHQLPATTGASTKVTERVARGSTNPAADWTARPKRKAI